MAGRKKEIIQMRFPNAHKGVKKLFIAELINIAAAVVAIIGTVFSVLATRTNPPTESMAALSGALVIVAAVALIVAFVIQIVGLVQGSRDEPQIHYALICVIISIIVSVLAMILSVIPNAVVVATVSTYSGIITKALTIASLQYILRGIAALATKLGNEKMAKAGKRLALVILILIVASILLNWIPTFIQNPSAELKNVFTILGIIARVADIVTSILVIVYYGKATKMLAQ